MHLDPVPGDYRPPGLVKEAIYYTAVPKRLISKVIDAVKAAVPTGTDNMQHVKRVQPIPGDPANLSVLLCSQTKISPDDLLALLSRIPFDAELQFGYQSKYPARTKEEAQEWSTQVWPLMWRGNTLAQPPKISDHDQEVALQTLLGLDGDVPAQCTARCLIRDPNADFAVVGEAEESLDRNFSQRHAVMAAIDRVAQRHRSDGAEGYLCVGMDVFCTTEPCVMCCMALVHSRIGRLFYKKSSASTKGAIEVYCLHGRSQLNHTYEVWKFNDSM